MYILVFHATKAFLVSVEATGEPGARQEVRNARALVVYNRVQHKLTGTFAHSIRCKVKVFTLVT